MGSEDQKLPRDGLALALLLLGWAALVRRFWFVCDDAYISFRYARNWAEGHGLRYNLGDHTPVEGFSNFLLVALGALLHRAGLDLETWMPRAGAASGAVLVVLVYAAARRRVGLPPSLAFLATATAAWSAPFAVWASGGLETMLFALLLFATFERLVLAPGLPTVPAAAALGLALALARVEGVLWTVALLGLAGATRRARGERALRPLLATAAAVLLPYAAYTLWRHDHFGLWQASTVHAKVAFGAGRLARGLAYVAVQAATTPPFALVVPGLVLALRPGRSARRADVLPLALVALAAVAFAVLVSGDFMAHGRFLVPALAFDGLLLAWILRAVGRGAATPAAVITGLAGVALALLSVFDVPAVPRGLLARVHFRSDRNELRSEHEYWREQRDNALRWAVRGDALRAVAVPGDSVVLGGIGATGYRSGLFVLDSYGLVTVEVSTRDRSDESADDDEDEGELGAPGHDRPVDRRWFLAQGYRPTFLLAKLRRASSAEGLAQQMDVSLGLMDEATRRGYVFEFHGVPTVAEDGGPGAGHALFLWRRIPDGVDPDEAWRRADAARARFLRTGRMPTLPLAPARLD